MESTATAPDILAQIAGRLSAADSFVQHTMGHRVFRAQVDIAPGRTDGQPGNGHTFDQHEGVALHHQPVSKGSGIALIGIADDVFLRLPGLIMHCLPFDAGGERRTTPATQARSFYVIHNRLGHHGHGLAQPPKTTMGPIVINRQWIGNTNP